MKRLMKAELAQGIEQRAAADLALGNIGGASVLVAQDGEVLYKNHFGTADLCEAPITDNTLFRLASMTKPITAVAAMILVERGLLSLEDTVDRYYPSFYPVRVRNADGSRTPTDKKVTIKNILTHSAGILSGVVEKETASAITDADRSCVESYVDFILRQPLSFVPGTAQEYSGTGAFSVLTGIIQKITGMPYGEFLKKEIFDPCDMQDTTFEPSFAQWDRLIAMHNKKEGKSVVGKTNAGCVFTNIPARNHLGGAGLISSLGDYYNFAQMLLGGGEFNEKRILSAESIALLSSPQFPKREEVAWGLGVRVIIDEKLSGLPYKTFGWSGAYGTHFWIDPQNRIIAIYLKNSHYDGGSGAITAKNFEKDVYAALETSP